MKNTFAGTFLIILALSFSTCMEEPIPEPVDYSWTQATVLDNQLDFTDFLVIDTTEYLGINYFDPGIDLWVFWSQDFTLDLNDDGADDLDFKLYYRNFLNGGSYQHFRFESINPNCSVIGTFRPDSIARWETYDTEEETRNWFTVVYDPADTINYDTLLALSAQHIIELPVLQIGDTVAVNGPFEYIQGLEYFFRNREYDYSEPWYDFTSTSSVLQGAWNPHETGYVAFKITGEEFNTIGWFRVILAGEFFKITKVAFVNIEI